eukprot:6184806-Pleurochrysis_carterae.AAC.2
MARSISSASTQRADGRCFDFPAQSCLVVVIVERLDSALARGRRSNRVANLKELRSSCAGTDSGHMKTLSPSLTIAGTFYVPLSVSLPNDFTRFTDAISGVLAGKQARIYLYARIVQFFLGLSLHATSLM